VKTKYISMKMLPKGSNPPKRAITGGVRYHCFLGIGLGIVLTRQGLSGTPLQLRPTIVPRRAKGKEMKAQMTNITT